MNRSAKRYAEVIGALLLVLLMLPILTSGLPAGLFTDLFWLLVIVLGIALLAVFEQGRRS